MTTIYTWYFWILQIVFFSFCFSLLVAIVLIVSYWIVEMMEKKKRKSLPKWSDEIDENEEGQ